MSTLKRDIAATFSGNVAVTILALGISVILARALGPSVRGVVPPDVIAGGSPAKALKHRDGVPARVLRCRSDND